MGGAQVGRAVSQGIVLRSRNCGTVIECFQDAERIPRDSAASYADYKKWRRGLKERFGPADSDSGQWATVMEKFPLP